MKGVVDESGKRQKVGFCFQFIGRGAGQGTQNNTACSILDAIKTKEQRRSSRGIKKVVIFKFGKN